MIDLTDKSAIVTGAAGGIGRATVEVLVTQGARVLMVDLNGDGDKDLFLPSTQGSCFVEQSFLDHGYAGGKASNAERKSTSRPAGN